MTVDELLCHCTGDISVETVDNGIVQCLNASKATQRVSVVLAVSSFCWDWHCSTPATEICITEFKADRVRSS